MHENCFEFPFHSLPQFSFHPQPEAAAQGWRHKEQSIKAASGAPQRRAGSAGLAAPLRAEHLEQTGSTEHSKAVC